MKSFFQVYQIKIQQAYLVFTILFFFILYFYSFKQGATGAPLALRLIKEFFFVAVSLCLVSVISLGKVKERILGNVFYFLLCVLIAIIIIHSFVQTGNQDFISRGLKLLIYPAFIFLWSSKVYDFFYRAKSHLIVFQFLVSTIALMTGLDLWEDHDFVGTIGNPNSFGLFSNLIFFLLLNEKRIKNYDRIALFVALVCIFFSKSFSQQLIFFTLFAFNVLFWVLTKNLEKLKLSSAISLFSVFIITFFDVFNKNVIIGLYSQVLSYIGKASPLSSSRLSHSITGRTKNLSSVLEYFNNGEWHDVLFGFSSQPFFTSDCQYFVFLINFGALGLALFLMSILSLLIYFFKKIYIYKEVAPFVVFCCFILTFIFTNILEYVPMCILFYAFMLFYSEEKQQAIITYEERN
jgi:hypothetical protein